MISFFYHICLSILAVVALPKLIFQCLFLNKYRKSFKNRLGLQLPSFTKEGQGPTIWIHAVSVGETRAILPLYTKMQHELPNATFIISSITETGHMEAKRTLTKAQLYFFLPLDFSWLIRKVIQKYRPDLLVLVEGEFWYHLVSEMKKEGGQIVLVNGKISERSAHRFSKVPSFSKKLFSSIDRFCVQNNPLQERFISLGIPLKKITVTGNLKLDIPTTPLTHSQIFQYKQEFGLNQEPILVIGSTHEGEEKALLNTLELVWKKIPHLKVFIVPRHPERFTTVANLLKQKQIPYFSYSDKEKPSDTRVILIDTMGILNICYQLADIAIVAGSFTDKVGGHNLFEPVAYGVPVLFGPHTFAQIDLREWILSQEAGREVTLETLSETLIQLLQTPSLDTLRKNAKKLSQTSLNITQKTWDAIFPFILNQK